ncbi:MAG: DUF411 domain-containing protein [Gemmatimonadales bacterium]|nr:DUF411 domain-containing protein [Gemmatimonadales bacterium]
MLISRRQLLAAALAIPFLPRRSLAATPMVVYKDAGCGCCKAWVAIMQKSGFEVSAIDTPDMSAIKKRYGVGDALASCHTALVGGYVVEGHVPADLVQRLLREKPKVTGLAVPGMPAGSPGMEAGGRKDPYDVLTFDKTGKTAVYAKR